MRRAAFTIIELLVVLVIMLAIAGVIFPALAGRATATRLQGAAGTITAAGALAQADAMERGRPCRFYAERSRDEWVLYVEDLSGGAEDSLAESESTRDPGARSRREVGSFRDVEIADSLPDPGLGGEFDAGATTGRFATLEDDLDIGEEERGTVSLGVWFADGSCRSRGPVYLTDRSGNRLVVRWADLTGRADVRRLPSEAEDGAGLDESEFDGPEPVRPAMGRGTP